LETLLQDRCQSLWDSERLQRFWFKGSDDKGCRIYTSNISEGAERDSIAEYIRFLHIAKGSAAELRTQVYIARQIEVLSSDEKSELVDDLKIVFSMLHSLIKSLKLKT